MTDSLRSESIRAALERALQGRQLLDHPFYRRWEAGGLALFELAAYAEQYRHVERTLPEVLETVVTGLDDDGARRMVSANLYEERSVPVAHVDLFETFAGAVGAASFSQVTPATAALLATQRAAAHSDPSTGLAALAAYETQAAAIASSKAAGLTRHYGLGETATSFWDVHAEMEASHATWTLTALEAIGADPAEVEEAGRRAADAWWAFLDEREAARPVTA